MTAPPPTPALPQNCWPVDTSCCSDWAGYAPAVQDRAMALAASAMRMLTAYRVGGCPVTVRPCKINPCDCRYDWYWYSGYGGTTTPMLYGGSWYNCGCGCAWDSCSCSKLEYVEIPPPVGNVTKVLLDGVTLDPATYRVDDGNRLIGLRGTQWPICQDMESALTEVNTFGVTYLNALPVDGLGSYAAGILACEFAKACSGGKCRLPTGVTSVVRQGVSYTIAAGAFADGLTGIQEVDTWVALYNPYHRKLPPTVWYPGIRTPSVTTWQTSSIS